MEVDREQIFPTGCPRLGEFMTVIRREAATLVAFIAFVFFTLFGDGLSPALIG